jgi:hypothetical protein
MTEPPAAGRPPRQDHPGTAPRREEADDQDLLTYSEAAARLHEEIQAEREHVAALRDSGEASALASAQERLTLLEDGARRHAGARIDERNFVKFFGYPARPPGPAGPGGRAPEG